MRPLLSLAIATLTLFVPLSVPAKPQDRDTATTAVDEAPQASKHWPDAFQLEVDRSGSFAGDALPPRRRWYGGYTLAPDVVATGLVVGGAELDSMPAILTGLGVYFVGAPVAHIAKGHPLKGLASIGLRTVPAFVLLAGASSGEQGSLGRGLTLAGISALAVMMIDAQALAWEDVPRTAGFEVLSASVTIDKNRVSASVGGVF